MSNFKFTPILLRHPNGNVAFNRDEDGWECTYNEAGKETSYRNSSGYSWERTYNEAGQETSFRDSDGYFKVNGKECTKEEYDAFIASQSKLAELEAKYKELGEEINKLKSK